MNNSKPVNNSKPTTPVSGKNRWTNFFIVQAWLVLLLASFFGAALAGIQLTLAPKIEANKLNETLEKVPELILGADAARTFKDSGRKMEINRQYMTAGTRTYSVFKAKKDNQTAGWVVKASGQGYADKIELLVGMDENASTVTGLFVLDQKETPGLGNNIMEPDWRKQFIHKPTHLQLTAVKTKADGPGEISAITGATISSKAVCDIVNQSVNDLRQPLIKAASDKENPSEKQPEKN